MSILRDILARTRVDLAARMREVSLEAVQRQPRYSAPRHSFGAALRGGTCRIIGEIKKASPSRGVLRPDFDVAAIAASYARGGASALSVLTDAPYFQGSTENLRIARDTVALPLLRKDFVVDAYQVHEARAFGADAVLLIVAALEDAVLKELLRETEAAGMDALVEVHNGVEAARAVDAGASIIGINNRNLETFQVDLHTTETIAPHLPRGIVIVSESGIHTAGDLRRLQACGVEAFLIGESFMREDDPGRALASLLQALQGGGQ